MVALLEAVPAAASRGEARLNGVPLRVVAPRFSAAVVAAVVGEGLHQP